MKTPDMAALDHALESNVREDGVRVAGEIAAPPATDGPDPAHGHTTRR